MDSCKKEIKLIRHAESIFNAVKAHALQNNTPRKEYAYGTHLIDCSLSNLGEVQAKEAAEKLRDEKIQVIYSSPMRRTLMTAKCISETNIYKPKIIVHPILRETFTCASDIPTNLEIIKNEFPEADFSFMDQYDDLDIWYIESLVNENAKSILMEEIKSHFKTKEEIKSGIDKFMNEKLKNFPEFHESGNDIVQRVNIAKDFLSGEIDKLRENFTILVVSHSYFLQRFFAKVFDKDGNPLNVKYIENAEIRDYKFE